MMRSELFSQKRKNRVNLLLQIAAGVCLITYAGYNVVDMDQQARLHHQTRR